MNVKYTIVSGMEIRLLSELRRCRGGTSPANLARLAEIDAASVYTFLRRLAQRDFVTCEPDPKAKRRGPVIYKATRDGLKAREHAAKQMGLRP